MRELMQQGAKHTMSSQEIASLTGKRHDNVMRDIRDMAVDLELDPLTFEEIYLDELNREQKEYRLDQDLTLTLVSGYSAKLRYAVVKMWRELETANQQPALDQTPTFSANGIHGKLKAGKIPKPFVKTLIAWSHRFPKAVKRDRIRDDFLLAPFLAIEFAENLITAREDLLEKPTVHGEDKYRGDFDERNVALREWLRGNAQVQSLVKASAPLAITH